jgi:hypothetical protein
MNASTRRLPAGGLAPIASLNMTRGIEGAHTTRAAHARQYERRMRQERENDVGLLGEEVARKRASGGASGSLAGSVMRQGYRCE